MKRKRGEHTEPMTSSEIILGARRLGKTGLFMAAVKNNLQMQLAEHMENRAFDRLKCLREIAKKKGMTYDSLASATGISRTNIGRTLAGKHLPRLDNYMKLYEIIMGEAYPDPCNKPETEEVSLAIKLMDNGSDILSFEDCLREEIDEGLIPPDLKALFRDLIYKAEKSYNSQFEIPTDETE